MIKIIRKILPNWLDQYPIIKEFIKFCLIGLTNLVVDFTIYWILTRIFGLFYIVAAIFSFIVAVSWSFALNRRWTFRYQGNDLKTRYVKFFVANCLSLGINLILFYLFVDWFNIHDLLAKFLVAVIVAFINFSLNKFWTFKVSDYKEMK